MTTGSTSPDQEEATVEAQEEAGTSEKAAELDPVVQRHLQRKRKKRRERLQGTPDEVVAKHTPDPSERVELSAEEARRMRGRNASPLGL